VFLLAAALSPSEATREFYATAAQIIPVLLLVLAVELRFFRLPHGTFRAAARAMFKPPPPSRSRRSRMRLDSTAMAEFMGAMFGLWTLSVLIIGEFVALHPIAQGDEDAGSPRAVYGAIAAGLAAVAVLAVIGEERQQAKEE
jgi:hypothetical protein